MHFATIPEHKNIKTYLTQAVHAKKIAHAHLFIGQEGSANLSLALAFASYLHCLESNVTNDACGKCAPCLKIKKWVHPDIQFIFPTPGLQQATDKQNSESNLLPQWRTFISTKPYGTISDWSYHINEEGKQLSIKVATVRQIITQMGLTAFEGKYKIIIIWLPELLHSVAANALLKKLEEPPQGTIFLLVSTYSDKVLNTITSRTQQHRVSLFTDGAIRKMVSQQYPSLIAAHLEEIILLAEGNLHKGFQLAMYDDVGNSLFEHFQYWMRYCYSQNMSELLLQAASFHTMDREKQKIFFNYVLHMMRAILLDKFNVAPLINSPVHEQHFIKKIGKHISHKQLTDYIGWTNQAYYYLERNANPKMVYMSLSIKIGQAFQLK